MGLQDVFDKLGERVVPMIGAKVFPDSMNIVRETQASDGGGGVVKSGSSVVNTTPIPCTYEPLTEKGFRRFQGETLTSTVDYVITCATHHDSILIDVRSSDRIKVLGRGNQTEKLFRVAGIKNFSGVYFEVIAKLEDES